MIIFRIISKLRFIFCLCAPIVVVSAGAVDTIVVSGQGALPIPVSISGFTGEAEEVIKFDLFVQGFKFTGPEEAQFILTVEISAR